MCLQFMSNAIRLMIYDSPRSVSCVSDAHPKICETFPPKKKNAPHREEGFEYRGSFSSGWHMNGRSFGRLIYDRSLVKKSHSWLPPGQSRLGRWRPLSNCWCYNEVWVVFWVSSFFLGYRTSPACVCVPRAWGPPPPRSKILLKWLVTHCGFSPARLRVVCSG